MTDLANPLTDDDQESTPSRRPRRAAWPILFALLTLVSVAGVVVAGLSLLRANQAAEEAGTAQSTADGLADRIEMYVGNVYAEIDRIDDAASVSPAALQAAIDGVRSDLDDIQLQIDGTQLQIDDTHLRIDRFADCENGNWSEFVDWDNANGGDFSFTNNCGQR